MLHRLCAVVAGDCLAVGSVRRPMRSVDHCSSVSRTNDSLSPRSVIQFRVEVSMGVFGASKGNGPSITYRQLDGSPTTYWSETYCWSLVCCLPSPPLCHLRLHLLALASSATRTLAAGCPRFRARTRSLPACPGSLEFGLSLSPTRLIVVPDSMRSAGPITGTRPSTPNASSRGYAVLLSFLSFWPFPSPLSRLCGGGFDSIRTACWLLLPRWLCLSCHLLRLTNAQRSSPS